jgi:hypothetical protein
VSDAALGDRSAFAERLRLQLKSRYSGADVDVDTARFALHVAAPGIDTVLPLAPLHHACIREPDRAAALIAQYVASIESRLTPHDAETLSIKRLLWCVRSNRYLDGVSRAGELLIVDVGGDMKAFVAEELPASIMRGVPRDEWHRMSVTDSAVRAAAEENTTARFTKLVDRIRTATRIPADGWRMAGDPLFQGSILMVPAILESLVERSGGDVLIAVPDRGLALAIPVALPGAERFARRVLREYREAMNPCSREVLRTDGRSLQTVTRHQPRAGGLVLPWLHE